MYDGVPVEQFHQFIAASSRTTLPISLSFPLHGSSSPPPTTNFLTFDPLLFPHHHQQQTLLQSQLLLHHHQLHHQPPPIKQEVNNTAPIYSSELGGGERLTPTIDPWSNDEVLALLRIKSSLDNWFPDFTWEHVSRKLAEVGYKRSAQKCKEKFVEETCRNFNSIEYNKNSCRYLISELDEQLYHSTDQNHHHHVIATDLPEIENQSKEDVQLPSEEEEVLVEGEGKIQGQDGNFEEDPRDIVLPCEQNVQVVKDDGLRLSKSKKRKRKSKKFEMFKRLCVEIVNKMMARQEEMHDKLLENMAYQDEQKIAREEAWKREEMERANKEIEIRQHEQVVAGDRQSTIIELLNKFTTSDHPIQFSFGINHEHLLNVHQIPISSSNPSTITTLPIEIPKLPFSSSQNPESGDTQRNPSQDTPPKPLQNPNSSNTSNLKDDIGKRWPRDEVLALINMRCSLYNGGSIDINDDKEGSGIANNNTSRSNNNNKGGSLWERISQGMLELGYNRSAKRCKEKWENINKYFRKTKDVNKKRSVDSRTCPYFHQLSSLYNQGKLVPAVTVVPSGESTEEKCSMSPENLQELPESTPTGSTQGGSNDSALNLHVREEGLTFEF